MSKTYRKIKYLTEGPYGSRDERYLYIEYLNSIDYVNVYDDTGTHLFTFSETEFDMGSALAVAFTNFNDERMETVLNKEWDMVVGREKEDSKIIGKKVKERWYPIYAPHIILGTNKSILDYINNGTDTSR